MTRLSDNSTYLVHLELGSEDHFAHYLIMHCYQDRNNRDHADQ